MFNSLMGKQSSITLLMTTILELYGTLLRWKLRGPSCTTMQTIRSVLLQILEMYYNNSIYIIQVRFKPSDYFTSEIVKSGKNVSKIYGSYMGFINFDDRRYWDHQRSLPYRLRFQESMLKSDHLKRKDRNLMIYMRLDEAQHEYDQYN